MGPWTPVQPLVASLHWKREQSLCAARDLLPAATSSHPRRPPLSPDVFTVFPDHLRVRTCPHPGIWRSGGLRETHPLPDMDGCVLSLWRKNIVFPCVAGSSHFFPENFLHRPIYRGQPSLGLNFSTFCSPLPPCCSCPPSPPFFLRCPPLCPPSAKKLVSSFPHRVSILLVSAAALEWSDASSGTDPNVGHTEGRKLLETPCLGPLGTEHVARIQVKAHGAEGEEEENLGREDTRQGGSMPYCVVLLHMGQRETLQVA